VGLKNLLPGKLLFALFAAGSISGLFATPGVPNCASGTLASYVSSSTFPTGGCSIGILDYYTFSYHPLSNAPLASDITVGLSKTGTGFSFSRTDGTAFTASAGTIVKFEIDYNILIDPAPIITGGDLGLDPPSGNVTITEYFCNDLQYVFSGFCFATIPTASTPQTLQVGTQATGLPLKKSIVFNPPAFNFQDVGIVFTLDGTNGTSTFDSLDNNTVVVAVPEPASAAVFVFGLLALGGGYKLRKQRSH